MDITNYLTEYLSPVIVLTCLCVGYVLKHWVKDADNRIIPTVCAILGAIVACVMHRENITVNIITGGLVSGLASTGLHQAFYQWISRKDDLPEIIDEDQKES